MSNEASLADDIVYFCKGKKCTKEETIELLKNVFGDLQWYTMDSDSERFRIVQNHVNRRWGGEENFPTIEDMKGKKKTKGKYEVKKKKRKNER